MNKLVCLVAVHFLVALEILGKFTAAFSCCHLSVRPARRSFIKNGGHICSVHQSQYHLPQWHEESAPENVYNYAGTVEDVRRVEFRAAQILQVEPRNEVGVSHVCTIDCGDEIHDNDLRTVVLNLPGKVRVEELIGRKVVSVANLPPENYQGIRATARLFASVNEDASVQSNRLEFLSVPASVPTGELLFFDGKEPSRPDTVLKFNSVWERVQSALRTNEAGEVLYVQDEGLFQLRTSQGPAKFLSSTAARVRADHERAIDRQRHQNTARLLRSSRAPVKNSLPEESMHYPSSYPATISSNIHNNVAQGYEFLSKLGRASPSDGQMPMPSDITPAMNNDYERNMIAPMTERNQFTSSLPEDAYTAIAHTPLTSIPPRDMPITTRPEAGIPAPVPFMTWDETTTTLPSSLETNPWGDEAQGMSIDVLQGLIPPPMDMSDNMDMVPPMSDNMDMVSPMQPPVLYSNSEIPFPSDDNSCNGGTMSEQISSTPSSFQPKVVDALPSAYGSISDRASGASLMPQKASLFHNDRANNNPTASTESTTQRQIKSANSLPPVLGPISARGLTPPQLRR